MTVPTIAFFNNKGGVGKTSLVYHLSCMYAEQEIEVLAVDLDPQANLSAAFLELERLEVLWQESQTVYSAIHPLKRGIGDVLEEPHVERIVDGLDLLVGDMALSNFEDDLSEQWPKAVDGEERAFRVLTAFWRVIQSCARHAGAGLALIDLGPNLGALNRAAMIASDHVVIPLAPDLFSLQGLRNLGPTLVEWRGKWQQRREGSPVADLDLPIGEMRPAGYVVLQHNVRQDRPVKAYERWAERIPAVYGEKVLGHGVEDGLTFEKDPSCLALLKHYRSLMPLAQEAKKPIFDLKPADGAIGSHFYGVQQARGDFLELARKILQSTNLTHLLQPVVP